MSKAFQCIFIFSFLFLSSCSTLHPTKQETSNQKAVAKEEKKVDETLVKLEKNEKNKKIQTSILAAGISYSLNQVTNAPIEVETALNLNERVISIVGAPHIDEWKKIKMTVDLLNSTLAEEKAKGKKLLEDRDSQIIKLQKEKNDLKDKYDDQMWDIADKAKEVAEKADASQATLNQMSGMFGLNAVFWGLKKFFFSCLTWIVVFAIAFFILRILSASNPIAAAVFSIFNMIASGFISLLKGLTPKAFELSKLTHASETSSFKDTLVKVVDVIQELKEKKKDNPDKTFELQDILKKFDGVMDKSEKDVIEKILKEQKWIK